jgi:putative ABC transport system ATP-binding protein
MPDSDRNFIRFEHLYKRYSEGGRQREVLRDASASFGRGELTAIIGKSGSGKSTLLNLISGIDSSDSGAIWVGDVELTKLDDHRRTLFRRRHIGFVFQFFNLIDTLTVWENVTLPLELCGVEPALGEEKAAGMLRSVGLLERRASFPDRLSGGEQQRVAIARALVHDPDIVLADEPTGNLDEVTGQEILALLDHLTRQRGKNLIMVTHSTDAAGSADRVLHLRDGCLS